MTMSVLSLEFVARQACVQLLLSDDYCETMLQSLDTGWYTAVSQSILDRLIKYTPERITDAMLNALLPSNGHQLLVKKCCNLSLMGLVHALKRCGNLERIDVHQCPRLIVGDVFEMMGLLQLPLTHLSLENTDVLQDHMVHVMITNLPHLGSLNVSSNQKLTNDVFLVDPKDQLTREVQTKGETDYKYRLWCVDVSGCRGITSLAILHLSSLCGPYLKQLNMSWTQVECLSLLYLAGYNVTAAITLLKQESVESRSKEEKNNMALWINTLEETLSYLQDRKNILIAIWSSMIVTDDDDVVVMKNTKVKDVDAAVDKQMLEAENMEVTESSLNVDVEDITIGVTTEGHGHEGVTNEGYGHEGVTTEGHGHEGVTTEGHGHEGVTTVGHGHEGFTIKGHGHEGVTNDGHGHEGVTTESHGHEDVTIEGHGHEGVTTEGHGYEGVTSEGHGHEGVTTEGHGHEGVTTEGHGHEGVTNEGYGHEGVTTEGHGHEGVTIEGHGHEGVTTEGHGHEGVTTEGHGHERVTTEGHGHEGVTTEGPGELGRIAETDSYNTYPLCHPDPSVSEVDSPPSSALYNQTSGSCLWCAQNSCVPVITGSSNFSTWPRDISTVQTHNCDINTGVQVEATLDTHTSCHLTYQAIHHNCDGLEENVKNLKTGPTVGHVNDPKESNSSLECKSDDSQDEKYSQDSMFARMDKVMIGDSNINNSTKEVHSNNNLQPIDGSSAQGIDTASGPPHKTIDKASTNNHGYNSRNGSTHNEVTTITEGSTDLVGSSQSDNNVSANGEVSVGQLLADVNEAKDSEVAVQTFIPQLQSLEVVDTKFIDTAIGNLCLKQFVLANPGLRKFCINWKGFTGECLKSLVPSLQELQVAEFVECSQLQTEGVLALGTSCTKLTHVNLTGVDFFKDAAILPLLCQSNLKSLSLAGSEVSDQTLFRIADKRGDSLLDVNLSWCEYNITETGINAICQKCTNLQVLDVRKCPISNLSLQLLGENCKNLTNLCIESVDDFGENSGFTSEGLLHIANNLTQLRQLNFSWNLSVTDEAIREILTRCVHLEQANMNGLKSITVAPFMPIIAGYRHEDQPMSLEPGVLTRSCVYAPNLCVLELEYCDLVEEQQLLRIVHACRGTLKITDYYGMIVEKEYNIYNEKSQ